MNDGDLQWLVRSQASLAREFCGDEHRWLHPMEAAQAERFTSPARRASWLWGRVVAKRLLLNTLAHTGLMPWEVSIQSLDQQQRGISPIIWIGEQQLPYQLSISHAGRWVAAALSPQSCIGIDLVDPQATDALRWWQPADEQVTPAIAWSVREAAFKCLSTASVFRPRAIELDPVGADRIDWTYRNELQSVQGSAQVTQTSEYVLTLAQLQQRHTVAASPSQATVACHAEAL